MAAASSSPVSAGGAREVRYARLADGMASPALSLQASPACSRGGGGAAAGSSAAEARELWRLAWPVMLTTLLEMLPSQIALAFVGHLGGTRERMAAAALATMFYNVTALSIGLGMTAALDTLCSQAVGAGVPRRMGLYVQRSLVVVAACLGPVVALNMFAGDILRALGQPEDVSRLAGAYVRYLLPGLPMVVTYDALRRPLLAQGITWPMVWLALANNCVVAALCGTLLGPLNAGYLGAAAAQSVGGLALVLMMAAYLVRSGRLAEFWGGWSRRALAPAGLRRFVALGLPAMAAICIEWWCFEVVALMSGWLPEPDTALAANAVCIQLANLAFAVYYGTSVAASVRVGTALGEGAPRAARLSNRVALAMAAAEAVCIGAVLLAARDHVALVFTSDPNVRRLVSRAVLALAAYQVADGLNTASGGVFRGAGEQRISAVVNFVAYWLLGLGLAYVFAFRLGYGVPGVWWGLSAAVGLAGFLSTCLTLRSDYARLAELAAERLADDAHAHAKEAADAGGGGGGGSGDDDDVGGADPPLLASAA